jgi:3-hydroxyisobutyrate dehydrogenase-like beta-hydroxyacid dehydrogenase
MAIVGVIGLGHMGSRIAYRLRGAEHDVRTWDHERNEGETPAEIAAQADVVFTVLPNDEVVREVVIDSGLLGSLRDGAVYADLSTTSPQLVVDLSRAAREVGAQMLDIEMSGSTPQVESGELALLVGGDEALMDRIRPVLDPLSKTIVHMGDIGAGAKMKLVVNTMLGVGMQALAEAIGLGEAIGLDRGRLLDGLEQMAVVAPAHKPKIANVRKDEYPVAFALRLMHKDFTLVLDEAAKAGLPMPATQASAGVSGAAVEDVDEDVDFSYVARYYDMSRSRA